MNSYDDILEWFFAHHDPKQHHKKQYQSAILYVDEAQKSSAEKALDNAKVVKLFDQDFKDFPFQKKHGNNVETYVQKLSQFYQAEDYHQKYWLRCQSAILREV